MAHLLRRQEEEAPVYDRGDMAYIILSGALVLFMVPGLAFLYSGLARRKNALSLVWAVAFGNGVTIFTWYFWGYTLAFSPTATNGFIGNLAHFGLMGVEGELSPGSPLVPGLLYSFFQLEFCAVTVAILMGALAERGRVMPMMVFIFFWITIVYCPVAYWVWGLNGWGYKWGVLDYAGGCPVEIGSGVGGLAYSWALGRRKERELINFRPHNVTLVTLGTFMLWFGWIGFNAGSAFGANLRAVLAAWNTCMTAGFAGITWCLLDYRLQKKYTMVGWCSGTIAGLVAATPSSGYIPIWASVALGIVTGILCNFGTKIKHWVRIDDALDLFAEHALGGIIGLLWNGLFAKTSLIALDGVNTAIPGGWLDRNWRALYVQLCAVLASSAYVFVVTALLAKGINFIPGLKLRADDHVESIGVDEDQIGEFAQDYIEVRRDFAAWGQYAADKDIHPVAAGARHGVPDVGAHTNMPPAERPDSSNEKV